MYNYVFSPTSDLRVQNQYSLHSTRSIRFKICQIIKTVKLNENTKKYFFGFGHIFCNQHPIEVSQCHHCTYNNDTVETQGRAPIFQYLPATLILKIYVSHPLLSHSGLISSCLTTGTVIEKRDDYH